MGCCGFGSAAGRERTRREIIIDEMLYHFESHPHEVEIYNEVDDFWEQYPGQDDYLSNGILTLSLASSSRVGPMPPALFRSRGLPFNNQLIDLLLLNMLTNHLLARTNLLSNESSGCGASLEAIRRLERIYVDSHTDLERFGECGISLEGFRLGDKVVVLPCAHAYKEEAILKWFEEHNSCPVCRASL
jgi:hypothetical protein